MKRNNRWNSYLLPLIAMVALLVLGGCRVFGSGGSESSDTPDTPDTADITAPTVTSTVPDALADGVAITSAIHATFSEAMSSATIIGENFMLATADGTTTVTGTVTYDSPSETAVFTPASLLTEDTTYSATVTTNVADEAGNLMAEDMVWTFTTAEPDTTAPTVISTVPADAATGVAVNSTITAAFSKAMHAATITTDNVTLTADGGAVTVDGTVTYDIPNERAIFVPDSILAEDTTYTATITTGVTDTAGNAMEADRVWTFTTAEAGQGPAPVNIGTAANFAILAKTGISSVPSSVITGDIGVSPAAASFITGFSLTHATGYATSDQVNGFVYAADLAPPTPVKMTTAISDMETAYTDAAGRVTPDFTNLGAGEIGGLTLAPGLYKWGTGVGISTDVTINGASNDVWIFQVANNLTVANGVRVTLSGGAQPRNIFWQVAGEATLGTTSHFEGILLSKTAIALATGATMNGRLLAQSETTLDQATVTEPAQ